MNPSEELAKGQGPLLASEASVRDGRVDQPEHAVEARRQGRRAEPLDRE
jgi:hypothetical protein